MKQSVVPFLCGAAVASVVWAAATLPSRENPPEAAPAVAAPEPAPAPAAPAAEPAAKPAEKPAPDVPAFDGVPPPEEPPAVGAAPAPQPPPAPGEAREDRRPERRGPPRWDEMTDEQREEMRQRFHRMADERAQRMADSFVERNGLAEADAETLLAIADGMNERALERIQRWTDLLDLQGAGAIPKDQGARVMRDLFSDLVDGYAELDEAFGTEWREKDPDFDLGQMISPAVWGSLFRLGGMGGPGGPGGGPRRPGGRGPGPGHGPGGAPGGPPAPGGAPR